MSVFVCLSNYTSIFLRPTEFSRKRQETPEKDVDSDNSDNDDDLFVNNNRPIMSDTESSSDEE